MKPYYEDGTVTLYHADCREVLPDILSAALIVTDPPYTFGIASAGQGNMKAGGWGDLMNSSVWYSSWLKECHRITENKQGAAWVFNSWRSFPVLARASYDVDWPIRSLLVWDKDWISASGAQGLRQSYELVALFGHREFGIENRSTRDIWREPWSSHKPNGHPAEKPVALLRRLIEASGETGLVVDPFAGSGSTLVAAKDLGRPAIGIEVEERYCELAARRLSQELLALVAHTDTQETE